MMAKTTNREWNGENKRSEQANWIIILINPFVMEQKANVGTYIVISPLNGQVNDFLIGLAFDSIRPIWLQSTKSPASD